MSIAIYIDPLISELVRKRLPTNRSFLVSDNFEKKHDALAPQQIVGTAQDDQPAPSTSIFRKPALSVYTEPI